MNIHADETTIAGQCQLTLTKQQAIDLYQSLARLPHIYFAGDARTIYEALRHAVSSYD
jgi:hypothetical protein